MILVGLSEPQVGHNICKSFATATSRHHACASVNSGRSCTCTMLPDETFQLPGALQRTVEHRRLRNSASTSGRDSAEPTQGIAQIRQRQALLAAMLLQDCRSASLVPLCPTAAGSCKDHSAWLTGRGPAVSLQLLCFRAALPAADTEKLPAVQLKCSQSRCPSPMILNKNTQ